MNVIKRIESYIPKGAAALAIDKEYVLELLQLAKLGQAALEAIKNESRDLTSTVCKRLPPEITSDYCGVQICKWSDFCKLRSKVQS